MDTTRLYGGTIAVVSGIYSIWLSTLGAGPTGSLMLALGIVVLVHGLVLFTDYAHLLGDASGPLMVGYAVLMIVMQAWLAIQQPGMGGTGMDGGGMNGGGMDGSMGMAGMSDPGMVAVAVIMLASGLIMTTRDGMGSDEMDDGM